MRTSQASAGGLIVRIGMDRRGQPGKLEQAVVVIYAPRHPVACPFYGSLEEAVVQAKKPPFRVRLDSIQMGSDHFVQFPAKTPQERSDEFIGVRKFVPFDYHLTGCSRQIGPVLHQRTFLTGDVRVVAPVE